MPKLAITRYAADELVQARKFAGKTKSVMKDDSPLRIDIRRVDSPGIELQLFFEARSSWNALPGVPSVRRPSASLLWHQKRIRGIDWTIKHEVTRNGMPTNEVIRGWHEHYWTDEDGSDSIRVPNPTPRNKDVSALIDWCCKQWNIEGMETPLELFK